MSKIAANQKSRKSLFRPTLWFSRLASSIGRPRFLGSSSTFAFNRNLFLVFARASKKPSVRLSVCFLPFARVHFTLHENAFVFVSAAVGFTSHFPGLLVIYVTACLMLQHFFCCCCALLDACPDFEDGFIHLRVGTGSFGLQVHPIIPFCQSQSLVPTLSAHAHVHAAFFCFFHRFLPTFLRKNLEIWMTTLGTSPTVVASFDLPKEFNGALLHASFHRRPMFPTGTWS